VIPVTTYELRVTPPGSIVLQVFGGQECPPDTSYSQALRLAGSKRSICASCWLVRRPPTAFP